MRDMLFCKLMGEKGVDFQQRSPCFYTMVWGQGSLVPLTAKGRFAFHSLVIWCRLPQSSRQSWGLLENTSDSYHEQDGRCHAGLQ